MKSASRNITLPSKNLPPIVLKVLKETGNPIKRAITAWISDTYDLYSAGDDGCKGFAYVVNIDPPQIKEYHGNWSGGGLGKMSIVDTVGQPKIPLTDNQIIVKGQSGGHPYSSITCSQIMADILVNRGIPLKKASDNTYTYLRDANIIDPRYGSGRTQIWYALPRSARELSLGGAFALKRGSLPDPFNLEETHVYMGNVNESNPHKIFEMMQGEFWSPEGEARGMPSVRKSGHTSMSVGDVIVISGDILMVDRMGFYDLLTAMERTASAKRVAAKAKDTKDGKLPPPNKFPAAKGLKDMTGGGAHKTRTKDVAKGQSRKEKHKKDPRDKEASAHTAAWRFSELDIPPYKLPKFNKWQASLPGSEVTDSPLNLALVDFFFYADAEKLEAISLKDSLEMAAWDMGYQNQPLRPGTSIDILAKVVHADIKKEYLDGKASKEGKTAAVDNPLRLQRDYGAE